MKVDPEIHCLDSAQQHPSSNQDDRPSNNTLDLIVIHNISLPPGEFGGSWIDALFTNTLTADAHPYFCAIHDLRVSAHLLIRRDAEMIQYVPFHRRAWHAGQSCYRGRTRCNDFSIGIELEGCDDIAYTDKQYQALAKVITALWQAYPTLSREHITGHADIAPGRKTDPGAAFDWLLLHQLLAEFDQ